MKKVLLVSNEDSFENPGRIPNAEAYGLSEGLCEFPNLSHTIRQLGAYELRPVHHTQIAQASEWAADYAILSGRFSDTPLTAAQMQSEYAELIAWIRKTSVPTLGICMGLQLICAAFGATTVPMEADAGEYGFTKLYQAAEHPLLFGLPQPFSCMEMHRCQVAEVPNGFMLLASSPVCRIQLICHESRPIAAAQFHPELTAADYCDGQKLLENFFAAFRV